VKPLGVVDSLDELTEVGLRVGKGLILLEIDLLDSLNAIDKRAGERRLAKLA
jgi:hypothetical protein